jgi:allantoinase
MTDQTGHSIRGRAPYLPIVDRPALKLPNNARVAVWTIVNVEEWSPLGAMPRAVLPPPMGQAMLPDVPNWSWHEYGMRVGFWRFLKALEDRGLKASFAVNGSAINTYRRACEAAHEAGWDFVGHGFMQGPMHKVADQKKAIDDTIEAIRGLTGRAPRGWESPGLTETDDTLDWLAEKGIEYVCDWVHDDLPVDMATRSGSITSIPYTVELNDVLMSAVQQQPSDEIFRRGKDQFDRLYQEGAEMARVMAISIHPYLTGVPHRIGYLEKLYDYIAEHDDVVMWTGSEITDWYRAAMSEFE